MSRIGLVIGLVALSTLMACGGAQTRMRRPFKAKYDVTNRERIWNAAVLALQEWNYPIQVIDEASGTITTGEVGGFEVPCGVGSCLAKESVSLSVSPTGVIIINVNRQIHSPMGLFGVYWFTPQLEEDVRNVERRQKEIALKIVEMAGVRRDSAAPGASDAPATKPSGRVP